MKYGVGKSLPITVTLWLEEQTQDRGIDSVLYSHPILSLSLIHHETNDIITSLLNKIYGLDLLVDELQNKIKLASIEGVRSYLVQKTSVAGVLVSEKHSSPITTTKSHRTLACSKLKNCCTENKCNVCDGPKNHSTVQSREFEDILKDNRLITKSERNKENIIVKGRMRSRSMVKQQGGVNQRSTNTAKSLDRKDERSTPKFSKGKQYLDVKNRKCLTFHSFEEPDAKKISRTPIAQESFGDISEFLPMDFQQLLQSPEDGFPKPCHNRQASDFTNFIQCGTNIISSIWSEKCEKMDEEAFPDDINPHWELKLNEMKKNTPWSSSNNITFTSWKMPFDFGTLLNNNNNNNMNNNNYKKGNYWSDVETTSLALKDDVCFFSCLNNRMDDSLIHRHDSSKQVKSKPAVYTYKQTISDQEDDLLTSTKTHFKPIKHEAPELADQASVTNYEDGTCFSVSSSLEKIHFQRSESGSLYLGPDQKYMEFKPDKDAPDTGFIPKFKVNLNEKFCQTDDTSRDNASDKGDEFFFPEDERLAEDMVNSLIQDEGEEERSAIKLQGFLTTWPVGTSDIWSNTVPYDKKSWMIGNTWNGNVSLDTGDGKEHYMRLRNELSEDGEELLSDLSSIHLFLDSEHMSDKVDYHQYNMIYCSNW